MMKKLFLTILLVLMLPGWAWGAVYYVDKTTGDDSDTGLTEALAWETLAKVESFGAGTEFTANDQILLKRGETWVETLKLYGTGTSGNVVTYGAYGAGVDPIITRIYHRNAMHGNVAGSNEYVTVENMRISNGAGIGGDIKTINYLTLKDLYIYDCSDRGISVGDEVGGMTGFTVQDVEIDNSTGFGIIFDQVVTSVLLERVVAHDGDRDGINARSATSVIVRDCVTYNNVEDGFDAGGVSGTVLFDRCLAYDNTSAGFSAKATNVAVTVTYDNCIAYGNNEGVETGNTCNVNIHNSTFYDNDKIGIYLTNDDTFIVKNNIIFGNGETPAVDGLQVSYLVAGQTLTADNNFYGVHSLGRSIYLSDEAAFKTFAEWQAWDGGAYGQNSLSGDPLFTNAAGDDFTLKPGSPARNSGDTSISSTRIKPGSTWPDGVVTMTDKTIGAYGSMRGAAGQ